MTKCDQCEEETPSPNFLILKQWGGAELRYLLCPFCAKLVRDFLDGFFEIKP